SRVNTEAEKGGCGGRETGITRKMVQKVFTGGSFRPIHAHSQTRHGLSMQRES
ncbi:hypothetical protein ABG768_025289, partial [Culter alburnus]